jgi:hypothetical protein
VVCFRKRLVELGDARAHHVLQVVEQGGVACDCIARLVNVSRAEADHAIARL